MGKKLVECPDCEAAVSPKATACPQCGRPLRSERRKTGCTTGCLAIVLAPFAALIAISVITGPTTDPNRAIRHSAPAAPTSKSSRPGMMPEVAAFLDEHAEFGTPTGVRNLVDWAKGKLQRVDFPGGKSLAFYEMNGKIITVWDRSAGAEDVIVWGKAYEPEPFVRVERAATDGLPAYSIPLIMELAVGGKHGDAIVPSLDPKTSLPEERESIAKRIAAREGVDELTLYSNTESRQANQSASYAESHPGAIESGYLGELERTGFRMPIGVEESAIRTARRKQDEPAWGEVREAVAKARAAGLEYSSTDAQARITWRVLDKELAPIIERHGLSRDDVAKLLAEYPDLGERPKE